MSSFPKWQLHRGYWQAGVRENTMDAFREAKKARCQMVEMDVQLSRDGVAHVFHDFTLKRFFHIDEPVKAQTSDDLEGLNIPRLEEVLLSDDVPEYLNIEIKTIDLWCLRIAKTICETIKEHGASKKILVSSFNPMCLFWAKQFLEDVPRALLIGDKPSLFDWKFKMSLFLSQPHFINARHTLVDDEESRSYLTSLGRPLMVWTVNEVSQAEHYLTHGAISVISDFLPTSNL